MTGSILVVYDGWSLPRLHQLGLPPLFLVL